MGNEQVRSKASQDRALADVLAGITNTECAVPACDRSAVAVVHQEDGTLFPACERHARKAAMLAFRVVRATDDPSAVAEHELAHARVGVGDAAPDVRLPLLEAGRVGDVVRIATAANGRPIALAFGAYSVAKFRKKLAEVEDLHERFSDRVTFFLVYTQEVRMGARRTDAAAEPGSLGERAALAQKLVDEFRLSTPVLLDRLDHDVTRAFGAFPLRLYLIGRDGRIAYQGQRGPYAFQPGELELAIREELASGNPAVGPRS